jgi:hypothetical protein
MRIRIPVNTAYGVLKRNPWNKDVLYRYPVAVPKSCTLCTGTLIVHIVRKVQTAQPGNGIS